MTSAAIQIGPMIAVTLPSVPESAGMARSHVRAVLECQGLGVYADDAEMVTAELVSNSVEHASASIADDITIAIMLVWNPPAVVLVVVDSSPAPPVMREPTLESDRGRGLRIVDALCARWGWQLRGKGKVVTAVLEKEEFPVNGSLTRPHAHWEKIMKRTAAHLETGENDWLMVRTNVLDDEAEEMLRLFAERRFLLPLPRPAVAVWSPDDDARIHRNIRQLRMEAEEAEGVTGLHDVPVDIPDSDMWGLMLDMTERLRKIQEIVTAPVALETGSDDDAA